MQNIPRQKISINKTSTSYCNNIVYNSVSSALQHPKSDE